MTYLIRECKFADEKEVLKLWKRNNLIDNTILYNDWKLIWSQLNPAYNNEWPIGWVIESKNKIVGSLCNVPLLYFYKGNKIITAAARGYVVDLEARFLSIKLASFFFNQKNVDLFISTTLNKNSSLIFKMFKCYPLNNDNYTSIMMCYINYKLIIKNKIKFFFSTNPFFVTIFSNFIASFFYFYNSFKTFILHKIKKKWAGEIKILKYSEINEDFDIIMQKQKKDLSNLIIDKSSKALRWHFSEKKMSKNINVILAAYIESQLKGYLMIQKIPVEKSLSHRFVISDIEVLNNENEIIENLIHSSYILANKENAHSISLIGMHKDIRNCFNKYKTSITKLDYMPVWFKTNKVELEKNLLSSNIWNPSLFDGDSSI